VEQAEPGVDHRLRDRSLLRMQVSAAEIRVSAAARNADAAPSAASARRRWLIRIGRLIFRLGSLLDHSPVSKEIPLGSIRAAHFITHPAFDHVVGLPTCA